MIAGLTLDQTRIMGILNVTPDSFSDGGELATVQDAVARAKALDADILDIGGESTRPGAETISISAEIGRVVPVIHAIRQAGISTPISVDTRKAAVARAALAAGANMVNDVSALRFDPDMAPLLAESRVPVCLMHAQGDPATMQKDPRYDDVFAEVFAFLQERIAAAVQAGIPRSHIIIDPGIGFGKTLQHNVTLLRRLSDLHALGQPILLGASRKRFIGQIAGGAAPQDRLGGSIAVALHGAALGVQILRVHDTVQTRQALSLRNVMTRVEL
jgi:dihydropteroate synthase